MAAGETTLVEDPFEEVDVGGNAENPMVRFCLHFCIDCTALNNGGPRVRIYPRMQTNATASCSTGQGESSTLCKSLKRLSNIYARRRRRTQRNDDDSLRSLTFLNRI